jgi:multidrug efflux pump
LTISTGFVVDDAIVMIENIARYIEEGEAPMEAALKGAGEIGFTIISLTVSLIAVLIPLLFMGDVVGRLFREFAITLSITIVISAVVSLTLVPTLAARWLKPKEAEKEEAKGHGLAGKVTELFDKLIARYDRALIWVLDHQLPTLLVAVATLVFTCLLYMLIPKGLFPTQDTGLVQGYTEAGQSVSYAQMASLQQKVATSLLKDPDVVSLTSFIGVDGTNTTLNAGRVLINLKPRGHRTGSLSAVMDHLRQRASSVAGMTLYLQPVQDLTVSVRLGGLRPEPDQPMGG